MLIDVKKHGVILKPTNLPFENLSVLNPATYQDGDEVHFFYRAVDKKHQSVIGYAKLSGPLKVVERWDKPIIEREHDYESKGVEDPRIVKIEDKFYLTYVAHDGKNAVVAYATSDDLKKFSKQGVITPQMPYHEAKKIFESVRSKLKDAYFYFASYYEENAGKDVLLWEKDAFFFPKKIKGKYALIHRILPDIQMVLFDEFKELKSKRFWKNNLKQIDKTVLLENKYWFETRNIGGGCVPIETNDGWLLIYHAVEGSNKGRVYHAAAALLDKNDPLKVIGRLHEPLFSPTEKYELEGFVPNVVFPTGSAIFGDDLYIYYGAADSAIAAASVNLKKLLKMLHESGKSK